MDRPSTAIATGLPSQTDKPQISAVTKTYFPTRLAFGVRSSK